MIADSMSRLEGDRSDWMLACSVFLKSIGFTIVWRRRPFAKVRVW